MRSWRSSQSEATRFGLLLSPGRKCLFGERRSKVQVKDFNRSQGLREQLLELFEIHPDHVDADEIVYQRVVGVIYNNRALRSAWRDFARPLGFGNGKPAGRADVIRALNTALERRAVDPAFCTILSYMIDWIDDITKTWYDMRN